MTNQEAINKLHVMKNLIEWDMPLDYQEVVDVAVEALEKQIPKKYKIIFNEIPICPVCGEGVCDMEWCNSCGQHIDNSVEDWL